MRYMRIYAETFSIAADQRQFTAQEVARVFFAPQAAIDAFDHVPGDTTTPPPAGAIQIGPVDV